MMRIGIDLGGTTVKAALCREDGTLLHKMNAPTRLGDADGLRADMKALALALCEKEAITPEQYRYRRTRLVRQGNLHAAVRNQFGYERRVLRASVRAGIPVRGPTG